MDQAFSFIDHQICFAVKSNSNLAVLNVLAKLGSGFDIVTGGELARVLAAGGDATKIVFSGLGKQEADIQKALEVGIACFNVESHAELDRIQKVAAGLGKKGSDFVTGKPRCRCENTSLYFDRFKRK
jgi:diaminopimelate decarboxylase